MQSKRYPANEILNIINAISSQGKKKNYKETLESLKTELTEKKDTPLPPNYFTHPAEREIIADGYHDHAVIEIRDAHDAVAEARSNRTYDEKTPEKIFRSIKHKALKAFQASKDFAPNNKYTTELDKQISQLDETIEEEINVSKLYYHFKWLLEKGDFNFKKHSHFIDNNEAIGKLKSFRSSTYFMFALDINTEKAKEFIQTAIKRNPKVAFDAINSPERKGDDVYGHTVSYLAAISKTPDIFEFICELLPKDQRRGFCKQANLVGNAAGWTPLMLALKLKRKKLTDYLLKNLQVSDCLATLPESSTHPRYSAFHFVIEDGRPKDLKKLLEILSANRTFLAPNQCSKFLNDLYRHATIILNSKKRDASNDECAEILLEMDAESAPTSARKELEATLKKYKEREEKARNSAKRKRESAGDTSSSRRVRARFNYTPLNNDGQTVSTAQTSHGSIDSEEEVDLTKLTESKQEPTLPFLGIDSGTFSAGAAAPFPEASPVLMDLGSDTETSNSNKITVIDLTTKTLYTVGYDKLVTLQRDYPAFNSKQTATFAAYMLREEAARRSARPSDESELFQTSFSFFKPISISEGTGVTARYTGAGAGAGSGSGSGSGSGAGSGSGSGSGAGSAAGQEEKKAAPEQSIVVHDFCGRAFVVDRAKFMALVEQSNLESSPAGGSLQIKGLARS